MFGTRTTASLPTISTHVRSGCVKPQSKLAVRPSANVRTPAIATSTPFT